MSLKVSTVEYYRSQTTPVSSAYRAYLKRSLDFLIALTVLILTLPLLLLVAGLLAIANRGTPFFTQKRPGRFEKPFHIIKFKTMNDRRDAQGQLLPDRERITFVGNLLRKTSIDELPQLINVLKGDMSLVGPRPLLYKYIPLYSAEQRRRHEVRPGVTGWAQVNGRNGISWCRKFAYDVQYVENHSFAFDLKVLLRTVRIVLLREGVNQSEGRPMEPFNGTN
jgi:lipopolysaccharide/colanic/teichoic acid biosynthesis glycosyltransferase